MNNPQPPSPAGSLQPSQPEDKKPLAIKRARTGIELRLPRIITIPLLVLFILLIAFPDYILGWIGAQSFSLQPFASVYSIFLLGIAVLTFTLLVVGWRLWKARSWAVTTGTVVKSEIVGRGRYRRPLIIYQYRIGEQVYESSTINAGGILKGNKYIQQMMSQFPVGLQVPIYYNPQNPTQAALQRKNTPLIFVLLLLILLLLVLFVIFGGLRWLRTNL